MLSLWLSLLFSTVYSDVTLDFFKANEPKSLQYVPVSASVARAYICYDYMISSCSGAEFTSVGATLPGSLTPAFTLTDAQCDSLLRIDVEVFSALALELFPFACPDWLPSLTYLLYKLGYLTMVSSFPSFISYVNAKDTVAAISTLGSSSICTVTFSTVCGVVVQALGTSC